MPDISGATSTSYTPQAADVGRRLRFKERATGPGGTSDWVYTDWSDPVQPAAATITPATSTAYISNPGIGFQETAGELATTPDERVRYIRSGTTNFYWSTINTADNVYDWDVIDDVLEAADAAGKQVNFRVISMRGEGFGGHQVPAWVVSLDASVIGGASSSGVDYRSSEPNYENATYQTYWAKFVEALRVRYDGDPRIAAIDISGYGDFNEWSFLPNHEFDTSPSTPANLQGLARRMLTHLFVGGSATDHARISVGGGGVDTGVSYNYTGFQQTQLLMPNAGIRHHTAWVARDFPHVGHRRDVVGETDDPVLFWNGGSTSALGGEFTAGLTAWDYLEAVWPQAPICGELAGVAVGDSNYNTFTVPNTPAIGQASHMTWCHDNLTGTRVLADMEAMFKNWGYRWVLTEVTWPGSATRSGTITPTFTVGNVGNAPSYPKINPFEVRWGLRDGGGAIVHEWTLDADPSDWQPADPLPGTPTAHTIDEVLTVPGSGELGAGEYTLTLGVVDPRLDLWVRFAVTDTPEADGRYDLGTVLVF